MENISNTVCKPHFLGLQQTNKQTEVFHSEFKENVVILTFLIPFTDLLRFMQWGKLHQGLGLVKFCFNHFLFWFKHIWKVRKLNLIFYIWKTFLSTNNIFVLLMNLSQSNSMELFCCPYKDLMNYILKNLVNFLFVGVCKKYFFELFA